MKIKLIKFKSVKSTNDVAIRLIKKNKLLSAIVTSKKQIKGRGTMGKKWVSQKGNLFFSIFFEIKEKKINFKQYAVLNALVLRKLISEFISKRISIKWPNDLIFKKKNLWNSTRNYNLQSKEIFDNWCRIKYESFSKQ